MKKNIFIGPCGGGKIQTNGASIKNYYICNAIRKYYKLYVLDTEFWRKNPFILMKVFYNLLFNRNATYIVSANNLSSYRLFTIFTLFNIKNVIYWVIGGSIPTWIETRKVNPHYYRVVKYFIVEGESMKAKLKKCGFDNVLCLPNFKKIDYIPIKKKVSVYEKIKFVFLSRITKDKGCNLILSAVAKLINEHSIGENRFLVDFYGPIAEDYKESFLEQVENLPNVQYKGFLNLRETSNYDKLSSYDIMLFPTYWHGEGFPGIFIDAFISGLPVIASDWNLNRDLISKDYSGIIIPPKNLVSLIHAMKDVICGKYDIKTMSEFCQDQAPKYDIGNLLTSELFIKIGIQ